MRIVQYNDIINKYTFNGKLDKYNNCYITDYQNINPLRLSQYYHLHKATMENLTACEGKQVIFNDVNDVKNFIHYYKFRNHNFGDLSLGDSITIMDGKYNKTWLIAGFNTQLDTDITLGSYGKEHIVLIPHTYILKCKLMGNNNMYGFIDTEMFQITLPQIDNNLQKILDNYLLPHKTLLSLGKKKCVQLYETKSLLMNHYQAFGNDIPYKCCDLLGYFVSSEKYIHNDITDDKYQFPLFNKDVKYRLSVDDGNIFYYWLRDDCGVEDFAVVNSQGYSHHLPADWQYGVMVVRPYILLG